MLTLTLTLTLTSSVDFLCCHTAASASAAALHRWQHLHARRRGHSRRHHHHLRNAFPDQNFQSDSVEPRSSCCRGAVAGVRRTMTRMAWDAVVDAVDSDVADAALDGKTIWKWERKSHC